MKLHFATSVLLILFFAGCSSSKLQTARQQFESGYYATTIENLRKAYPKEKEAKAKSEMTYLLAESYRQMSDYNQASNWYKNAIRRGHAAPLLPIRLAETLQGAEKLDEAATAFQSVLKENPGNQRAKNGLAGMEQYAAWQKSPGFYIISPVEELNSVASETGIAINDPGKLGIFLVAAPASSEGKKKNPATGEPFTKIYSSFYQPEKEKWARRETADGLLPNMPEGQFSSVSVSADKQQLLFSLAPFIAGQKQFAQLFVSHKEEGKWGAPSPLAFCLHGFQYPQAVWAADGKSIFFSSDQPGGQGELDIWQVASEGDGKFGKPACLGATINTPGNESHPFDRGNGQLFFSSDYHPGAGGLDIFRADLQPGGEWFVRNMEYPVNSPANDFGICFLPEKERGFLLSNRKGAKKSDVFSFYLPPKLFQCRGKVRNDDTDSIIGNTNIRIMAEDGSVQRIVTKDGTFTADLLPDKEYLLVAYKKGFLNAQARISTKGMREARAFDLDFRQTPTDKPIRVENILYASGKWELLSSSKMALDSLVEVLNINPQIRVEIMAHTDDVGDEAANIDLSQKRAQAIVEYLVGKGVAPKRLIPRGYGESQPARISAKLARQWAFLRADDVLSFDFIQKLPPNQREVAQSLNRRTEFRVISEQ